MELSIIHRPETNRFETVVDGVTAYVEYRKEDDSIDILHTIVPPAIEGRGIASRLSKRLVRMPQYGCNAKKTDRNHSASR